MSSRRGRPPIVAEVELVEAELAAGQRQDQAVVGNRLGELGVVAASGARAVAAADQEEVADRAGLHGVDHLAGDAEHGIVAEADGDLLVADRPRRSRGSQRRGNHRAEVLVGDVPARRAMRRRRR